ncbi:MAG: bifunctional pyr operon transcriptional regulator/uracil phosphoribosyltransferase PyrR [Porcipelethomonas sp.]
MIRKAVIMDESNMKRAIARITYEILERNKGTENLCIVGIFSRGVALACRIASKISELEGEKIPCGALDITAFRDDKKPADTADRTVIDFDVSNKKVVIVDDVFYTGRSTRAAIDALMERGRPQSIQLAVLVDRGHRELPIRPDYVGKNLPTSREESVKVSVIETDGSDSVAIYSGQEE